MAGLSRSVRHRLARRRRWWVWWPVPVVSPYDDRLRRAAVGDHVCQHFPVSDMGGGDRTKPKG